MIGASLFQSLLNGIGAILAWLYHLIPNYGLTIIILTLGIRLLLLPLGIKQIRSMQAMQVIQPKVKALQLKYKGKGTEGKQKLQEETMKLYREHGVNPFGGCLPILAQFPVLIALFAVLNVPKGLPHVLGSAGNPTKLYRDIAWTTGQASGIRFLGANLTCSAIEAGTKVDVPKEDGIVLKSDETIRLSNGQRKPGFTKDCGHGGPVKIPYYLFLVAMVGTTFYQQRQMQRASPGQSQQQRMLTYFMPVFFGWIGLRFPAGLVVYWTTTNLVQIGQQHFMLPRLAKEATGDGSQRPKGTSGRPPGGRAVGRGPGGRGQGRSESGRGSERSGGAAPSRGIGGGGARAPRNAPGGKGTGARGPAVSPGGPRPSQEDGSEQGDGGGEERSDGRGRPETRPLREATGGGRPGPGAGGKSASGGRRDGDRKKRRKR